MYEYFGHGFHIISVMTRVKSQNSHHNVKESYEIHVLMSASLGIKRLRNSELRWIYCGRKNFYHKSPTSPVLPESAADERKVYPLGQSFYSSPNIFRYNRAGVHLWRRCRECPWSCMHKKHIAVYCSPATALSSPHPCIGLLGKADLSTRSLLYICTRSGNID